MKKAILIFAMVLCLGSLASARPWAIVVSLEESHIRIIDLGQSPPRVYGPFLEGQLGHARGLLDVAVTPDDHYAFFSNFFDYEVYRVDISDPTNPRLAGKLSIAEIYPEDIAISPDGSFAVVTDGSSYTSENLIFFNPQTFTSYSAYVLQTHGGSAQAVDIAPNGTVIVCDFLYDRIIFGRVNSSYNGLVSENALSMVDAVNVAISPDGTTALVAGLYARRLGVFQITGAGAVVPGVPSYLDLGVPPQSIDFSPDGRRAYVVSNSATSDPPDKFSWVNVTAPGRVSMGASPAASLFSTCYGAYYGIDILSAAPGGNWAVVGTNGVPGRFDPQLVNLNTFAVSPIATNGANPSGVATFWGSLLPPTGLACAVMENSYIFYKEYVNRLSWQADPNTRADVVTYRVYRKTYGAADSAYQLLGEVGSTTPQYNDRNVDRNVRYTYGVSAVDDLGRESRLASVSN